MTPKLRVYQPLLERLKSCKDAFSGDLLGIVANDDLIILSFLCETSDDELAVSEKNFPTGVDLCGAICCTETISSSSDLSLDFEELSKDIVVTDTPVVLGYELAGHSLKAYFHKNGICVETNFTPIVEAEIWRRFTLFRILCPIDLVFRASSQDDKMKCFDHFQKEVSSGAALFHMTEIMRYISPAAEDATESAENVNSFVECLKKAEIDFKTNEVPKPFTVSVLFKRTEQRAKDFNMPALSIHQVKETFESVEHHIVLDALTMFEKGKGEKQLYNALVSSCCRNLKLLKIYQFMVEDEYPKVYHFYPKPLVHFVTVAYTIGNTDDSFTETRKAMHAQFGLSSNIPYFRKMREYVFGKVVTKGAQLENVHQGLRPSGINGEVSLVNGTYLYYHYNHNDENDKGWGCAYRSLQTLFSWYKLDGWTKLEVPSIREIQHTLVKIRDKPSSFVGSKDWIGSLEVSFVLETTLAVRSRVVNVPAGQSMNEFAYEVANHFRKQGSPIMIGGGVLAHTILGVEINDETDAVRFLVLDPHYTGPDELEMVQKKGGVGWKDANFWKSDTFYNMCMPQKKTGGI